MNESPLAMTPLDVIEERDRQNPSRLLRRFSLLCLISIIAILLFAGTGIYRIYQSEMIQIAQETAVYVGNAILEQERKVLFKKSGGRGTIHISAQDFDALDARMTGFLHAFNMYKIKVFSADKEIVYSTDETIIGRIEGENHKLDAVLAQGVVISVLEKKQTVRDLKGEQHFNLDVVESYVPIRGGAGNIGDPVVGSFEVYVDITSAHQRIVRAVTSTLVVLGVVLVAVFGLLFLLMKKGMSELKRVQEALQQLASTDPLTGIFNRRYLFKRMQEERSRTRRHAENSSKRKIAFLMLDIDHFKKVNDTHGHQMGDHVLRELSSRIKSCLRDYDILGRYGGEEFLAVLPHTTVEDATIVAERMRATVHGTPVVSGDISIIVSVSIGMAVTVSMDEDFSETIRRADEGLYKAKKNGRNQVCVALRNGEARQTASSPAA